MNNTDILIIGRSSAGFVAVYTAKKENPGKDITIIRKKEKVTQPCNIPYIFSSVGISGEKLMPKKDFKYSGMQIKIAEVTNLNFKLKICETIDKEKIKYKKLIFVSDSIPVKPGRLEGEDLNNLFAILKNNHLINFKLKQIA